MSDGAFRVGFVFHIKITSPLYPFRSFLSFPHKLSLCTSCVPTNATLLIIIAVQLVAPPINLALCYVDVGGFYVSNATSFLPNIAKFYSKGSTTAVARDQMPSVSAPNWGTIITGMGPVESGIPDNSWVPADDNPTDPTVLELPPISGRGKVCHDPCCIVPMGLCNATVCLLTPCNMYLTT